jgi:predicted RNA-binding protein with PIN domain
VEGHKTELLDYHNIHVVYTREAETADQYIEKFAHENGKKYRVTVATSDGLEQIIIRGEGCLLISAREFEKEVAERSRQITEEFHQQKEKGKNYLLDGVDSQILSQTYINRKES